MSVASATPSRRLLNNRRTNTPLGQSVTSTATISSTQSTLPEYIAPTFPLNIKGQDAIAALLRKYSTAAVEKKLGDANIALADCAADINERYSEMKRSHERNKKRRDREAADGEDAEPYNKEADEKLETVRVRVEGMTARMEKETRKVIDGYAHCNALNAAITALQNTAHYASTQATQAPSSAITLPGSTLPPPGTAAPPSLAPALKEALEKHTDKYTSISLTKRYTTHNDYIGFKQVVHDAMHPEDSSIPLPPPRTWFASEEGAAPPQPGVTEPGNEDSDDDIAIDRERISTRCPITLREFEEPVKSTKCNHSFERRAIFEMIDQSRPPTAAERARFVSSVECPATGCHQTLTKDDLTTDAVLVRRIRRIQRAKAREEEEGEMEEVGGRGRDARGNAIDVEEIESGDEVSDVDEVGNEESVKRESQRVRKRRVDDIED